MFLYFDRLSRVSEVEPSGLPAGRRGSEFRFPIRPSAKGRISPLAEA